jgi:hypothetical protein
MSTRLGLVLGLALAGASAVWWLGASRVAIEGGVDPAAVAGNALFVLAAARASLIALLAPRAAAVGGYMAGLRACIPVVSAAWPVVALAWAASSDSAARTIATEAALLAGAAAAPLVGRALARALKQGPAMEALAMATGALLASAVWFLAAQGT